jgi:hypothetical protein
MTRTVGPVRPFQSEALWSEAVWISSEDLESTTQASAQVCWALDKHGVRSVRSRVTLWSASGGDFIFERNRSEIPTAQGGRGSGQGLVRAEKESLTCAGETSDGVRRVAAVADNLNLICFLMVWWCNSGAELRLILFFASIGFR